VNPSLLCNDHIPGPVLLLLPVCRFACWSIHGCQCSSVDTTSCCCLVLRELQREEIHVERQHYGEQPPTDDHVSLTLWSYALNYRFSTPPTVPESTVYTAQVLPHLARLCCPSHASLARKGHWPKAWRACDKKPSYDWPAGGV
jgi:hypothetical protein